MQTLRHIFFITLLLGLVAGCSGPAVEVPENPAPRPKGKPVPVSSGKLPAKPAPAKPR